VREHNEDTIGVDADIGLFVLADGMGGYNAG
jgi:protein phosphatase